MKMFSSFDSDPIKELESLELEQRLLTSVNLQFNYYPIECLEIQNNLNVIHAVYLGNTNRPNIIFNDRNYFPTFYQTSDIYLYGNKIHEGTHKAELIVKHTPISSSVIPLYLCFFLYPQPQPEPQRLPINQPSKIINALIQSAEPSLIYPINSGDIDLSSFFDQYSVFVNDIQNTDLQINWKIYETFNNEGNKCYVVLIEKPIIINSEDFNNIPSSNIGELKQPFIVKNINILSSTKQQSVEGFTNVSGTKSYALDLEKDNEMICDIIPDTEAGDVSVYQIPITGLTYQNKKSMGLLTMIIYVIITLTIFIIFMVGSAILSNYIIPNDNYRDHMLTRITFITSVIFAIIIIGCIGGGIYYDDNIPLYSGFFMITLLVVVIIGINLISKALVPSKITV